MNTDKTGNSRKNHEERLYIAYGSNLNLGQMAGRCPNANPAGVRTTEAEVWHNWKATHDKPFYWDHPLYAVWEKLLSPDSQRRRGIPETSVALQQIGRAHV